MFAMVFDIKHDMYTMIWFNRALRKAQAIGMLIVHVTTYKKNKHKKPNSIQEEN